MKLIAIEQDMLKDHALLGKGELCLFLMEYTSRKPYGYSDGNQKIQNLKISINEPNQYRLRHKWAAIEQVANDLAEAFPSDKKYSCVFIPVPSSKIKSDPRYDNMLISVLSLFRDKLIEAGHYVSVCEAISQKESTEAVHCDANNRLSVQELKNNYQLDLQSILSFDPRIFIFIFDDVISAGAHFRAVKDMLLEVNPALQIGGFFIARRVFPPEPPVIEYD